LCRAHFTLYGWNAVKDLPVVAEPSTKTAEAVGRRREEPPPWTGGAGLIGEEPVTGLRAVAVGVEQRIGQMGRGELRFSGR